MRANMCLVSLLFCSAPAFAQSLPPVAPPSASQPPPEKIAPGGMPSGSQSGQTLSDKLAKQQGTLDPPKVDPGIQAPLPSPSRGTMPVIPPPGTPGGNPAVVPK